MTFNHLKYHFSCFLIASKARSELTKLKSQGRDFRKVASSNKSHLEAQTGVFRLFMKGIFDPYML